MNPLVSILIPAFNAEAWIADTIRSALGQTWPRIEVIVVDDGSTDGTVDVVRRHESSKLKLVRQENGGACRARNRALRECQGDYIQWLDADDLLAPQKIERQLALAQTQAATDELYASAWGTFFYRPRRAKFRPTPLWRDLDAVEWLILRMSNPWIMPDMAWLVGRRLTERAGPWDERLARNDDGEYFCRVVSRCDRVRFASGSRCYYRMTNPSGVSRSRSRKASESLCLSIDLETRHVLERETSERTRKACIGRLHVGVSLLEAEAPDLAGALRRRILELGGDVVPARTTRRRALAKGIIGERNTGLLKRVVGQTHRRLSCNIDRWLSRFSGAGF